MIDLLEREAEVASLRADLESAREGRGKAVLIEGPAGIGKTKLLAAVRERAKQSGFRTLNARSGELERDFPFGVVRQLFRHVLEAEASQRDRLFAGPAAQAERVFSSEATAGITDSSYDVLHGLFWLAWNTVEGRPTLLSVDDVHWTDAASMRFLAYLFRQVEDMPLLMVVSVRSDEDGSEVLDSIARDATTRRIRPEPLSRDAVHLLVDEALPHVAGDSAIITEIHEVTRGNPYLIHELLFEISGAGGDRDHLFRRIRQAAPQRVARAVLGRIAALGTPALHLARAVAVLGDHALPDRAANLAGLQPQEGALAASALTRAWILEEGSPLRFVHPLARTAVYRDILAGDRAAAHATAGRLIEASAGGAEDVALHLLSTAPSGDAWAVETLRRAANSALGRGAPETAAQFLTRALSEPPEPDQRVRVVLDLGTAESRIGAPAALEHLSEAFETSDDPGILSQAAIQLGQTMIMSDQYQEGGRVLERALKRLAAMDSSLSALIEGLFLLNGECTTGMRELVLPRLKAVAQRQKEGEDFPPYVLAVLALECIAGSGTAERALVLAEKAWAEGGLLVLTGPDSPFVAVTIFTASVAGRSDLGERWSNEAMAFAARAGNVIGFRNATCGRAFSRHVGGDLEGAEADAKAFFEMAFEARVVIMAPVMLAILIEVSREQGRFGEAWELLRETDLSGLDTSTALFPTLYESKGRLLLDEGSAADALSELARCRSWEEGWGHDTGIYLLWREVSARAHQLSGNASEALELAGEQLRLARLYGAPRPLGIALRTAGLIQGGERGLDLLRESVEALAPSDARLEHARSLIELGAALRRAGRRVEARDLLREGREIAIRCSASVLIDRGTQELLASGARPRRLATSGLDALTPSERRIARLAAQGLTNRDIAQTLFVTPKTIETHLRNIFRKLGIQSRTQLVPVVGSNAGPGGFEAQESRPSDG